MVCLGLYVFLGFCFWQGFGSVHLAVRALVCCALQPSSHADVLRFWSAGCRKGSPCGGFLFFLGGFRFVVYMNYCPPVPVTLPGWMLAMVG